MKDYANSKDHARRGGIYWVDIPHHSGAEIAKKRPAIVLSTDEYNEDGRVATVVFCSSAVQWKEMPTHVDVYMESRPDNKVLCEHIYTVDMGRIEGLIRWASAEEMREIERETARYLGLNVANAHAASVTPEILQQIREQEEVIIAQRGEIRALERFLEKLMRK